MRDGTKAMLRRTLLEETKRNMKSAADAINNEEWNMAFRELGRALGYLYDMNEEFLESVIYAARTDDFDLNTVDWDAAMRRDDV